VRNSPKECSARGLNCLFTICTPTKPSEDAEISVHQAWRWDHK